MSRNAAAPRNTRSQPASLPEAVAQQPDPEPARPAPSLTLDLPLVTTTIRAPQFGVPAVETVAQAAREQLPSRGDALFYALLAGTVAVGLIPWPVAAAVGIGTAPAQRDKR